MTITVGADTYVAVTDADAYFAARGVATWATADTASREAALLRATTYLDGTYRFVGQLADPSQSLAWPRVGATDMEGRIVAGIPRAVEHACAELALVALGADLAPPLDRGGRIRSEQIGPLQVSYEDGAPSGRTFPFVDLLLAGLIAGTTGSRVVTRA